MSIKLKNKKYWQGAIIKIANGDLQTYFYIQIYNTNIADIKNSNKLLIL